MRVAVPKEGYDWNPIRSFPRNDACLCGSGKKFKKCHLPLLPMCVPKNEVEQLRGLMKRYHEGKPILLEEPKEPLER